MRTIWTTLPTTLFAAILGCSGGGAAGTGGSGGAAGSGAAGGGGAAAALCADGFADCDGDASNGCEAALRTSTRNCGACGHACAAGPSATAVCAAGACALACDPGTADCDGKPENGCETAVASDDKNCGACGVACAQGCSNGTCDLTVLAKDQPSPVDIAADASGAYWVSFGSGKAADGALMHEGAAGGAAAALAPSLVGPRALLLGEDDVVCATTDGSILRVPKAGGAPVALATKQALPVALAMRGSTLYWANAGTPPAFADGALMALDLSDPNATPAVVGALSPAPLVTAIAAVGDQIYAALFGSGQAPDGALVRLPASGHDAAAEVVASGLQSPHALAASEGALWIAVKGAILSLPAGAASPKPFLQALVHQPMLLAIDGDRLWWTTVSAVNGEVQSAKLDGSDPRTRARNLPQPRGIAVRAGDVFVTEVSTNGSPGTGQVVRAAKE